MKFVYGLPDSLALMRDIYRYGAAIMLSGNQVVALGATRLFMSDEHSAI